VRHLIADAIRLMQATGSKLGTTATLTMKLRSCLQSVSAPSTHSLLQQQLILHKGLPMP